MAKSEKMDPAFYKFIWVPLMAVLGIIIISDVLASAVPNKFLRFFLVTGGILGALAVYYKDQLRTFIKHG